MKIDGDLVSVIIPVYNVEKYVKRCINSVMNQTYLNLEIILVDDGSTDLSGQICDEYAEKDSRILCLHKSNGGLSDARNYAIERSHGKYITYIDSDDFVSRYYVEILYKNLIETDADISIGNFIRVMEKDKIADEPEHNDMIIFDKMGSLSALYDNDYKYQFTIAWGKLYKAEIFSDIRYPKGRNYEDTSIAHLIYDSVTKVVYEDVKLYYYLIRETSITKSERFIKDDAIMAVEDRMDYFAERGYKELLVKSREQYLATLMGVYARIHSDVTDVSGKKRQIYVRVKDVYKTYHKELYDKKIKLRVILFILMPKIYCKILLGLTS